MTDSTSTEQTDVVADATRVPCNSNTVLVVDDEEAIRNVFKMVLAFGLPECEVMTAANGQEALDCFKECHQRLLLMDLHMPVMNGEIAFTQIRAHCDAVNWEMPSIVFCTGYDPPNGVQNVVSGNPLHCLLRKPVSNDTLLDALRVRLNGKGEDLA